MVFGEDSDSSIVWREKYRQLEQHNLALQERIRELMDALHKKEEQLKEAKTEIERLKNEIITYREAINIEKEEIQSLRSKIRELERATKAGEQLKRESTLSAKREIFSPKGGRKLEPKMLEAIISIAVSTEYPEAPIAKDAIDKLVDAMNDTEISELAILTLFLAEPKRSFSFDDIARIIGNSDIESALEYLIRKNVIKELPGKKYKLVKGEEEEEVIAPQNWEALSLDELFDNLTKLVETADDDTIIQALEEFRDTLMQKEISASTVFFSIRKVIDGLKRGTATKEDVILGINEWKSKIIPD